MSRLRPTLAQLDALYQRMYREAENERAGARNRTTSLTRRARHLGRAEGIDVAMEWLADMMPERTYTPEKRTSHE